MNWAHNNSSLRSSLELNSWAYLVWMSRLLRISIVEYPTRAIFDTHVLWRMTSCSFYSLVRYLIWRILVSAVLIPRTAESRARYFGWMGWPRSVYRVKLVPKKSLILSAFYAQTRTSKKKGTTMVTQKQWERIWPLDNRNLYRSLIPLYREALHVEFLWMF